MNIKQAKTIVLTDYLERLGFAPASRRGNEVWYTSPFRPDERTPSFKIDATKNVWFDHGLGQGGTIIDFVQCLHQTDNVSRVLAIIAETTGGVEQVNQMKFEREVLSQHKAKPTPELESLAVINDKRLIDYLENRAIPLDLARQYVQEASYRVGTHSYKALAFANDSGGYELRNARFQGTLQNKDFTFLVKPERQDVAVFEGFFDFLSTLVHYGQTQPNANVMILNSVSMVDRAISKFKEQGIHTLYTYLDHDAAGETAKAKLEAIEHGLRVRDVSQFYLGFKDANEMLLAKQREKLHKSIEVDGIDHE